MNVIWSVVNPPLQACFESNVEFYVTRNQKQESADCLTGESLISGQRVVGETVTSALTMDESKMWHPDFATAAQYGVSPYPPHHHQQMFSTRLAEWPFGAPRTVLALCELQTMFQ